MLIPLKNEVIGTQEGGGIVKHLSAFVFGNIVCCRKVPFSEQQTWGPISIGVRRHTKTTYSNNAMMVHFLLSDSANTSDLGP